MSLKKCGQRQVSDAGPVVVMMVGALAMGSQMAGQIHDGMEIRDRAAGVETCQAATASLGLRIQNLGQIDDSQIA